MALLIYTLEQPEEWNRVVRSFFRHDVYHLSGYVKAFRLHGDGDPMLFCYEGQSIRGINVVMKRDIADDPCFADQIAPDTYFDFITPYGYGGWLIEGDGDKAELFSAYETWCRENRIVSEFVRYHPMLDNAESSEGFYEVVRLGKTVAMDLSSPDTIWANLTSKNRNMVRKAQKSGVAIYRGQFPSIYQTFKEIYDSTMDADNAAEYYHFKDEFYDSVRNDLSEEAQIFWAEVDGRIIAISIMLSENGYMNYHLSGSLREYQHLAPSNLLLYKAALWGCRNGCKSLHMGGGVGSKEDSLYKFKSAFNRNETKQFAIGKKIYLQDVYENLAQMKVSDPENNFFPKYRA
jgi:hypothetical protein